MEAVCKEKDHRDRDRGGGAVGEGSCQRKFLLLSTLDALHTVPRSSLTAHCSYNM